MKIIAVEGLDKSGKYSLVGFLTDQLERKGFKVIQSEFPQYDSPIGELVGQWLRGEFEADQYTFELLQAADKQRMQRLFEKFEYEEGADFLIIDRYVLSQWAYAIAQGIDLCFAESLQHYMRQPDMTIYIDIPAEVSMSRKGKHNGGENDRYESDLQLLQNVRAIYKQSLNDRDLCIDGTQEMDAVHEEVLRYVDEWLLQIN